MKTNFPKASLGGLGKVDLLKTLNSIIALPPGQRVRLLHKVVFLDPTKGCRIKGSLSDWKGLPDSKSLFNAPPGCGLPIGNLTSQLFSNIYLNELDQFCKRELGFRHYGRYVDDFYMVDEAKERLEGAVPLIEDFLRTNLHLSLIARKTRIISCSCGVPFLGAVVCPNGRFLRSRTRRHLDHRWTEALFVRQGSHPGSHPPPKKKFSTWTQEIAKRIRNV